MRYRETYRMTESPRCDQREGRDYTRAEIDIEHLVIPRGSVLLEELLLLGHASAARVITAVDRSCHQKLCDTSRDGSNNNEANDAQ